jgi:hypothetical protein|tara:strand:+ start:137 stop:283 length:147 start_codon:yes stop_codon:yes gene_type:complete
MANNPYFDNPNKDKNLAEMQRKFHENFYFDSEGLIRRKTNEKRKPNNA